MDNAIEQQITEIINEIILDLCPDFVLVPKYGGMMIEVIAGDEKSQIGGYFFYKARMSLEFSNGADLDDPNKYLEGGGKFRRHIKIYNANDIETKKFRTFLLQAIQKYLCKIT